MHRCSLCQEFKQLKVRLIAARKLVNRTLKLQAYIGAQTTSQCLSSESRMAASRTCYLVNATQLYKHLLLLLLLLLLQPFYGSPDFDWDNQGEPVPEETFTHSHLSWSSHTHTHTQYASLHLIPDNHTDTPPLSSVKALKGV